MGWSLRRWLESCSPDSFINGLSSSSLRCECAWSLSSVSMSLQRGSKTLCRKYPSISSSNLAWSLPSSKCFTLLRGWQQSCNTMNVKGSLHQNIHNQFVNQLDFPIYNFEEGFFWKFVTKNLISCLGCYVKMNACKIFPWSFVGSYWNE